MASDYTVGDLVAEFLTQCGVTTAFGIASVHNIPMLDAIGRRNAIRFMMARGELGGAHMADGYARVSGGLGVIFSSTGPGAANAIGGLIEARFSGTPVLHITGQTATKFVDREMGTVHDAPDQLGMLRSVSKSAYRIRSAQQAIGVLTRAAVDALTPPTGPVSVEVPIDLQRTPVERPAIFDNFVLPLPPPRTPSDAELDELAARIVAAKRPMLWLGSGARRAGAAVHKLLDLGFTMINSINGKGTVSEEHPMNLGGLHGNGMPKVQQFYQTVDLMLAVGTRLRGQETGDFVVKLPPNLIQIDADPLANGRTYANTYFVCGDAQATLEALLPRIEGRMKIDPAYRGEFAALKQTARADFLATLGVYGTFPEQLRPRDAEGRDLGARRDAEQHHLGQPHLPGVQPASERLPGRRRHRPGTVARHRRRRRGERPQDRGDDRRRRLLPQCRRAVDRGAGEARPQRDRDERPRLWRDQAHPGRDRAGPPVLRRSARPRPRTACGAGRHSVLEGAERRCVRRHGGKSIAHKGPSLVEVDMNAVGEFPAYYPFNQRPAA